MTRKLYALVLLACLSGWCAAELLKVDLPELPEITPITELPPGFFTCLGYTGDINECIKNGLEIAKPRLKNGIPELRIPVLDPMFIKQTKVQLATGIGEGYLNLQDLIIHGISESIVKNVSHKTEGKHVQLLLSTESPSIQNEGTYEGELFVANMNMQLRGHFKGNLTRLLLDIVLEGDISERNGHKYLNLTEFNFEPEIEDMIFEANKLEPTDAMSSIILHIINSHWRSLYKVVLKQTREIWEPIALQVANAYLDAIPFDLFFDKP